MPGAFFLPSEHGARFGNHQVVGAPITLGPVRVGSVPGGLCGGMVLDSLHAWRHGLRPAELRATDLQRVFAAQLRSFELRRAPLLYLRLQRPGAGRLRHAVTERAITVITRSLLAGEPVPVALVCRLSGNPADVISHHVVLAYALLDSTGESAEYAVYDPNHPGDDSVRLRLSPRGCRHSRGRRVYAAFALRAR